MNIIILFKQIQNKNKFLYSLIAMFGTWFFMKLTIKTT